MLREGLRAMKLGTSVRFLFPTGPATHERFKALLAAMPKGAFIERPMGAYAPEEQARNLMEVAAAARAAGLDGLLTGDSHGASPVYAATFSPLPTLARLMSVTGDMPVGVVLLAPFYHPVLLAEQLGTLAAFAAAPLIVTFVLGGRPPQFAAFGMEEKSRVGRLEEVEAITRALLAGERVTHRGRYFTLEGATTARPPPAPAARPVRSCAATSTSAPPMRMRAPSSAPSWPRATAAPASTSCWWAAPPPSSRGCAATARWASTS
jgi:hypothetical protein